MAAHRVGSPRLNGADESRTPVSARRAVIAAVIGNALEWYDFILYALFSSSIAATFFPAKTQITSLLLAVGTFGAGFIVRPLGALVLGQYADRHGRRAALTLIILLMTCATMLIVFTPGWRQIGPLAPLLIVISRLLQGFSVGGELGSSTALLIEAAPPGARVFYASWQGSSQLMASLAASVAAAVATSLMTPAQLAAGGWRLPFALGLLIGPVGWYIRRHVKEPPSVARALSLQSSPLRALWRHHRSALIRSVALVSISTMASYVLELNMPAYAHRQLGLPLRDTFLSIVVADTAGIVLGPLAGALSDRIGPRRVMLPAVVTLAVIAVPCFFLLTRFPVLATLMAVQTLCLALRTTLTAPAYGILGSFFPPEVRSSGLAVSYNTSVLLFGGFAPLITTWLIAATGNRLMPGVYVACGGVVTLVALLWRWRWGHSLPGNVAGERIRA